MTKSEKLELLLLLLLLLMLVIIIFNKNEFQYQIEYTKCNGNTGSISIISNEKPYIMTYKEAVPILVLQSEKDILNVCDFTVVKKTLINN